MRAFFRCAAGRISAGFGPGSSCAEMERADLKVSPLSKKSTLRKISCSVVVVVALSETAAITPAAAGPEQPIPAFDEAGFSSTTTGSTSTTGHIATSKSGRGRQAEGQGEK